MSLYEQPGNPYEHPLNIVFEDGGARIYYGSERWGPPDAWALPGGTWTKDKFEAMDAAILIDKLIRENSNADLGADFVVCGATGRGA